MPGGGGGGGSPVQRVVERTVEVDPDVEAIRAKMKAELEAKMAKVGTPALRTTERRAGGSTPAAATVVHWCAL